MTTKYLQILDNMAWLKTIKYVINKYLQRCGELQHRTTSCRPSGHNTTIMVNLGVLLLKVRDYQVSHAKLLRTHLNHFPHWKG